MDEYTLTEENAGKPILGAFPYFGNKRKVAARVWGLIGDPGNVVEPFGGSAAFLLGRPVWGGQRIETLNEWNPYIVNFYRAVCADPEEVARYAANPVFEVDLHSRHLWLLDQVLTQGFRERMLTDPDAYDAKAAGWWVWGQGLWIGYGWADPDNHMATRKSIPQISGGKRGVHRKEPTGRARRQIPFMSGAQGVLSSLRHNETDEDAEPVNGAHLHEYFALLKRRLEKVRIICGDWERVCKPSITTEQGLTGVFLDPPYLTGAAAYGEGVKATVALDVLEWCKANWSNPLLRIVLAGYEGEFEVPAAWPSLSWEAPPSYQSQKGNGRRERLWYSPACLNMDLGPLFQQLS